MLAALAAPLKNCTLKVCWPAASARPPFMYCEESCRPSKLMTVVPSIISLLPSPECRVKAYSPSLGTVI